MMVKKAVCAFLALLLVLAVFHPAESALLLKGKSVILGEGNPIESDLYIFTQTADIARQVQGDVTAFCQWFHQEGAVEDNLFCFAQSITVEGEVGGDVIGFAQDIRLNAPIGGGFRGGCANFKLNERINGDVIIGAGTVFIGEKAVVEGNLYVWGEEVDIAGEIHGKVIGGVKRFYLSGLVTDNVRLDLGDIGKIKEGRIAQGWIGETESIIITSSGKIMGDLIYSRSKPIKADLKDRIGGEIIFKQRLAEDEDEDGHALCWIFSVLLLLANLVTAFILIAFFKDRIRGTFEYFSGQPWRTLLIGFLCLIVIPVAAVIAFCLILTIPIGVIMFALYGIFLYIGWVSAGILLGSLIFNLFGNSTPSLFLAALIGLPLLMILGLIPILGYLVSFIAIVAGLGVVLVGIYDVLRG